MKLSQHQTQIQKQIMAPVMQQSIGILLLPLLDLRQAIDLELESNPLLEIHEQAFDPDGTGPEAPFRETMNEEIQRLMDAPPHPYLSNEIGEEENPDQQIWEGETLEQKLLRQLRIDLDDALKIRIGEMIIGQINEDGYLTASCAEIAGCLGISNVESVKDILSLIQNYEPLGIAARNLQECLLIQARHQFNGSAPLAEKIISCHLNDLGRKRYDLIAKRLKISIEQVRHCARLIATLDPRPARNFRPVSRANYVRPDIFIHADPAQKGEYILEVNEKGIPPLRINPVYRKLLRKKNLTAKEKEFLREKLQNALAFIKSIRQRGSTMKEIGKYLLEKQRDFFKHGHLALKPMGLKDAAAALDRNESTISRAISQKYIDTPQGILPLKYFFSRSVGENQTNSGTASRCVKEVIRRLIEEENKEHPLSDQEIQQLLEHQGITVARRTIGKYRGQLSILPSHLRKT